MNSEKVKEIKKGLECCVDSIKYGCEGCPYHKSSSDCQELLIWDMQTYINELESENKELRVVIDIANERTYRKKFTDEWRKEYQKELDKQGNGHIAGHPDFDLVYKLYFEQKDRIVELEKENRQLNKTINNIQKGFDNGEFISKDCKISALKQFAERLKGCAFCDEYGDSCVWVEEIDETLKEFINE